MALAQLLVASLAYALGGLFMKQSAGLTHAGPTAAFLLLFAGGSVVQALGMRQGDLGPAYIFVLGVEAVITAILSALYLRESYSASRLAAISVVIAGILWLRQT
jgi:multidrug transporter EmrE-like cation transporter